PVPLTFSSSMSLSGGKTETLSDEGTFDESTIGEGTRYAEGYRAEVTDSVELCYIATSELMRSIGVKVVPDVYTITYTDGTGEETYFADEIYSAYGNDATPAFQGSTERAHYTIKGWDPEVAETVAADATYTAIWTEN
ncbi:MAG: hypothetical protein LUF30_01045, partial [Lachnospiraceae bacterium]|nr:hypothetical protein [Lachnospiraceae bacterium]